LLAEFVNLAIKGKNSLQVCVLCLLSLATVADSHTYRKWATSQLKTILQNVHIHTHFHSQTNTHTDAHTVRIRNIVVNPLTMSVDFCKLRFGHPVVQLQSLSSLHIHNKPLFIIYR